MTARHGTENCESTNAVDPAEGGRTTPKNNIACRTHIWPICTFAGALKRGSDEVRRDDISRVIVRVRACEWAERQKGGTVEWGAAEPSRLSGLGASL